jgi:hypothetical protein
MKPYPVRNEVWAMNGSKDDNASVELSEDDLVSIAPDPLAAAKVKRPTILGVAPPGPELLFASPVPPWLPPRVGPDHTEPQEAAREQVQSEAPPVSRPIEWLKKQSSVLGCTHVDARSKQRFAHGSVPPGLSEKLSFVRQLSQSIGAELGLDRLMEVHLASKDLHSATIQLRDGGFVDLQAAPHTNMRHLAQQLLNSE